MFCSCADCLVNTVNCEGFMGKGVAYQFKVKFPENNKDYIKSCKNGKLHIGTLHYYREKGVTIINFPTKDRWREKSKMSYIETGLDEMVKLLPELSVKSVAIPPLGCGNGGLDWGDVKARIEEKLFPLQGQYLFMVYEPSKGNIQKVNAVPSLNISSLVLMKIKMGLDKATPLRLQNSAYFMDIFLRNHYFKFQKYKYGPYSYSIEKISKEIGEYQKYYGLKSTEDTFQKVYQLICSDKTDKQLDKMDVAIRRAVKLINSIESDMELKGIALILYLVENSKELLGEEEMIEQVKAWTSGEENPFIVENIRLNIKFLEERQLIEKDILGNYRLAEYI